MALLKQKKFGKKSILFPSDSNESMEFVACDVGSYIVLNLV